MREHILIEIVDSVACTGTCAGCTIPADLRKDSERQAMPEFVLDKVVAAIKRYVATMPADSRVRLVFSLGDHFLYDDAVLSSIYDKASGIMAGPGRDDDAFPDVYKNEAIMMTFSLIGRYQHLVERMEFHAKRTADGVLLLPAIVLDPKKLTNPALREDYVKSISKANELFKMQLLVVNLSDEVVAEVTPEALLQFAAENKMSAMDVVWNLSPTNLPNAYDQCIDDISNWLIAFDKAYVQQDAVEEAHAKTVIDLIRAADVMRAQQDDWLTSPQFMAHLDSIVHKAIRIDMQGNVYPRFEGVGDVPQNGDAGYKPIGNVLTEPLGKILDRGAAAMHRSIARDMSMQPCAGCDEAHVCALTAFHIYTRTLREAGRTEAFTRECPHVAKPLIKHWRQRAGLDQACAAHG